jgi:hypothetical protein
MVKDFVVVNGLFGLKQAGPSGNAYGLQGRGHGQADGLVGAGGVRNQEVGLQGVKAPVDTFHRGIIRF